MQNLACVCPTFLFLPSGFRIDFLALPFLDVFLSCWFSVPNASHRLSVLAIDTPFRFISWLIPRLRLRLQHVDLTADCRPSGEDGHESVQKQSRRRRHNYNKIFVQRPSVRPRQAIFNEGHKSMYQVLQH